jgi:hypothetical protein
VAPGDRLVTAADHRPALDFYWPEHPELAAVEPLHPPQPLGQVRRLYPSPAAARHEDLKDILLRDTSHSIWYVDRTNMGHLAVIGLAFDPQITAHYRLTDPAWFFRGDLTLVRLDPIGVDRPRSRASCDSSRIPPDMRPPDDR